MKKEKNFIQHSFKEILDAIVLNYTWGISSLVLPIMLLASPAVLFSSEETWGKKLTFLSMFILIPLILFLQSLLITFVCYFGSKVRLFIELKMRPNN